MKSIDCIICGSKKKKCLRKQDFDDPYLRLLNQNYDMSTVRQWVTCEGCGFIYREPTLDKADLALLYHRFRDLSFRSESPDDYFSRITSLPVNESENHEKVAWLYDNLNEKKKSGWLLDIGCGGGVFIHTFKRYFADWRASGVEPTPEFARLASRRLSEDIISGEYRVDLFPDKKFDLITVNQVLEHVLDPIEFCVDLKKDLAPGGNIYIEVPDVADFDTLPVDHDRFQMQHLWYFSCDSLAKISEKAELAIRKIDTHITRRGRNNIRAILQPWK